jgi:enamine deaminase RidA (YjgF/YER057c/UK114 family)
MLKSLIPETIAPPFARYAHGVVVDNAGGMVVTSGQLALRLDGTVPEGAKAQAELCFFNIDEILKQAHTDAEHVVKINAFVTDRDHMAGYMQARDAWLSRVNNLPASTLMIVSGFTRPEFVVEIEVVAALP